MKKVKRNVAALLMLGIVAASVAGCGASGGSAPAGAQATGAGATAGSAADTGQTTAAQAAATQAAKEKDPGEPDYENMTMEELYELALKETGTITIYSTTSSAQTAVKKFQKSYPDLAKRIECIDAKTNTVTDRIATENETGNINADVLQVNDNSGAIYYELVQYDYLDIFQPTAVKEHVDPSLLQYGMPVYASYSPWYYNTEQYPDGCPIESWWDIVQGYDETTGSYIDASGKNNQYWTIYTKDITSASYASLWAQLIVDGDLLAKQYEEQYGKPLEYTYMSRLENTPGIMEFPENNGSVELFWRFTQMKMTELDDGDQVVSAVDESLNGPTLGLCSGGKLENVNSGMTINWVTGLKPYTAFMTCDYIYAVKGCDNPAGARLFIYYVLGGEDGQSGCLSAYDGIGKWSIRDDYAFEKTPYTREEVNLISPDFSEIYAFYPNVQAYWTFWRSKAPST
ncbi:MAG: hypothetical protein LBR77_03425 [Lachnospiraceae bacterium]|nr:hypothetical protein [Lachnospiraceae bacterium]